MATCRKGGHKCWISVRFIERHLRRGRSGDPLRRRVQESIKGLQRMLMFDESRDGSPKRLLFMLVWVALLAVPGCSTLELGETRDDHKATLTTATHNAKPRRVDARQRGGATTLEPTPSLGTVGPGEHGESGPYGTIHLASFTPSPFEQDAATLDRGAGNSLLEERVS